MGWAGTGAVIFMRKKALSFLLAFLALWFSSWILDVVARAQAPGDTPGYATKAKGAVLLDANTGRVLFAQNADAPLPMASTTKIMTALLTLEQPDLETPFIVDSKAIRVEGSSMGLREGDTATLHTLAYGMLLPSGNDAAGAAAARIAGGAAPFSRLMNERAREIGMENTQFVTPSGLHDDNHYSTALDMALLTREALQNLLFAEICAKSSAKVSFGNPPYDRWLQNHNRLLRSYEGTVGVKTGFTDKAGRCLVSAVERDGVRLIAVTLNCPDDWNEHRNLYNRYFGLLRKETPVLPTVSVPVTGGSVQSVEGIFAESPTLALLPGESLDMTVTAQKLVFAPVREGGVVGLATISCGGETLWEAPLTAASTVPAVTEENKSLMERIGEWFSG